MIAAALAIGGYARHQRIDLERILAVGWRLVGIIFLSTVLFQSFVTNFQTTYTAIELWKGARTTLSEYITVHGVFLFAIATYLVWMSLQTSMAQAFVRTARLLAAKPSDCAV